MDDNRMLNLYIFDYCRKRNFKNSALAFYNEVLASSNGLDPANNSTGGDTSPPVLSGADAHQLVADFSAIPPLPIPIDTPDGGFLFEWWTVFWDLFKARSASGGTREALILAEHQKKRQLQTNDQLQAYLTQVIAPSSSSASVSAPAPGPAPGPAASPPVPSQPPIRAGSLMSAPGAPPAAAPMPQQPSQPPQPSQPQQPTQPTQQQPQPILSPAAHAAYAQQVANYQQLAAMQPLVHPTSAVAAANAVVRGSVTPGPGASSATATPGASQPSQLQPPQSQPQPQADSAVQQPQMNNSGTSLPGSAAPSSLPPSSSGVSPTLQSMLFAAAMRDLGFEGRDTKTLNEHEKDRVLQFMRAKLAMMSGQQQGGGGNGGGATMQARGPSMGPPTPSSAAHLQLGSQQPGRAGGSMAPPERRTAATAGGKLGSATPGAAPTPPPGASADGPPTRKRMRTEGGFSPSPTISQTPLLPNAQPTSQALQAQQQAAYAQAQASAQAAHSQAMHAQAVAMHQAQQARTGPGSTPQPGQPMPMPGTSGGMPGQQPQPNPLSSPPPGSMAMAMPGQQQQPPQPQQIGAPGGPGGMRLPMYPNPTQLAIPAGFPNQQIPALQQQHRMFLMLQQNINQNGYTPSQSEAHLIQTHMTLLTTLHHQAQQQQQNMAQQEAHHAHLQAQAHAQAQAQAQHSQQLQAQAAAAAQMRAMMGQPQQPGQMTTPHQPGQLMFPPQPGQGPQTGQSPALSQLGFPGQQPAGGQPGMVMMQQQPGQQQPGQPQGMMMQGMPPTSMGLSMMHPGAGGQQPQQHSMMQMNASGQPIPVSQAGAGGMSQGSASQSTSLGFFGGGGATTQMQPTQGPVAASMMPGQIGGGSSAAVAAGNGSGAFDLFNFGMPDFGASFGTGSNAPDISAGGTSGADDLLGFLNGGIDDVMFQPSSTGGGGGASVSDFGPGARSTGNLAPDMTLRAGLPTAQSKLTACDLHPSARLVAAGSSDNKVALWALRKKIEGSGDDEKKDDEYQALPVLQDFQGQVSSVRFSGSHLLTAAFDGFIRVFAVDPDAPSLESMVRPEREFTAGSVATAVDQLASPADQLVCTVDGEGQLRLFDRGSGQLMALAPLLEAVMAHSNGGKPAYSPNPLRACPVRGSRTLAVAIATWLLLVDVPATAGELSLTHHVRVVSTAHSGKIHALDWAADGSLLVTASEDRVVVWEVASGTCRQLAATQAPSATTRITSAAFVPSPPPSIGTDAPPPPPPPPTQVVFGGYEHLYLWRFGQTSMSSPPMTGSGTAPKCLARAHPNGNVAALAAAIDANDGSVAVVSAGSCADVHPVKIWRVNES